MSFKKETLSLWNGRAPVEICTLRFFVGTKSVRIIISVDGLMNNIRLVVLGLLMQIRRLLMMYGLMRDRLSFVVHNLLVHVLWFVAD